MFLRGGGTILVTGGARAGKSDFALGLAKRTVVRRRLFVATGVSCDPEMRDRITRHRKSRDGHWVTLEEPIRLPERLPKRFLAPGHLILFDCLPTFITNLLLDQKTPRQIHSRVQALLKICRRPGLFSILVTNEVGLGIVPDHPLGREFRDLLGKVNQQVARAADQVYLLVSGIPLRLK